MHLTHPYEYFRGKGQGKEGAFMCTDGGDRTENSVDEISVDKKPVMDFGFYELVYLVAQFDAHLCRVVPGSESSNLFLLFSFRFRKTPQFPKRNKHNHHEAI